LSDALRKQKIEIKTKKRWKKHKKQKICVLPAAIVRNNFLCFFFVFSPWQQEEDSSERAVNMEIMIQNMNNKKKMPFGASIERVSASCNFFRAFVLNSSSPQSLLGWLK
jgi:hypothetical protein